MESPVRISLGAVIVVTLLLYSCIEVDSAVPQETKGTTLEVETSPRNTRFNTTSLHNRSKSKIPDVALNELNPKVTTSEENTEKNAKYKDRGRVRFNIQSKTSSESPLKRITSTKGPSVIIVTPTPEVKKPAQIIDSMHKYKKSKISIKNISSTSPSVSLKIETQSEEEFDDEDESFEKYTSSKFDDNNFFSFPNFSDDINDKDADKSETKSVYDYSTPFSFNDYFTKDNFVSKEDSYKSDFFDFHSELTTPKNVFFDKKYEEISKSIMNNLDTIKSKSPGLNKTNVHKINIGFEKNSNDTPSNKSTVFFKNTKEIRYLDNENANTVNKELSDVQGTSIYYEMTVLSTETYNLNDTNDDDCDDKLQSENATTLEAKVTPPTIIDIPSRKYPDPESPGGISHASSNLLLKSVTPTFNSQTSIAVSTQSILSYSIPPTSQSPKIFSSSYNRNKNFAKRLNFGNLKDSPNSVTPQSEGVLGQTNRQQIRRFHHTTPKNKPIWMAPKRNSNRTTVTRIPMTIYSEHFDIKDQFTTTKRPVQSSKPILTTFASEIDPVLQSDISGTKKVVQSPSISDNTIPSLWKRGSTKFSSSTASSTEAQSTATDLEIPPTLTAWALASLISPPPSPNLAVNATRSTHKSVDENELQKVGDIIDIKETTTTSTTTTTTTTTIGSTDFISKNITEIDQNKLKSIFTTTTVHSDLSSNENTTESFSERLPAESNISLQSSKKPLPETVKTKNVFNATTAPTISEGKTTWISATENFDDSNDKKINESSEKETIPPVNATRSTGFESITKLPSGVTTPKDDIITTDLEEKSESVTVNDISIPTTTDYEITTRRFSYKPIEDITKTTETDQTTVWHSAFPSHVKENSADDVLITTYRPKYITTTDVAEEITTILTEPTPTVEISSQVTDNTETIITTTERIEEETTTTEPSTMVDHSEETIQPETTTFESTTPIETTTIVISIATEINTEKGIFTTTEIPTTIYATEISVMQSDASSEENSDSNEVIIIQENKTTTASTVETTAATVVSTTTESLKPSKATPTTTEIKTTINDMNERIIETTVSFENTTYDVTTKSINDLEDLTSFAGEMTTETSSRVLTEEAGSGVAIAIAVSTIGVIALVLVIGLLVVVRRRGRRGIYAQRCTPVSLDAYSLDSVSIGHRKGNQRLRASKRSYGNPAYDDEVTSHPMNYAALANFAMDVDSITSEFAEIPSVTVRPEEVPPGCEDKNRYSNVLPLPETRVPLQRIGNDPTTEYINANYVTGPGNIRNFYILCQAPLANTVVDFWRMTWEQNSRLIVMLTEYMENGVEKCYEYLPPSEISDNRRTFGNFQIILKKREQRDKYAISSVQLINLSTRTWREVTHLWYFWPAKGVPDDYDSVIDFLFEMRSYMKVSQTAKEYDEEGVEIIYEDENRSSYNNLSKLRSDVNGSGHGLNIYSPARAEEKLRRDRPTNGTLGKMKAASEIQSVRPCVVVCASGAGRSAALVAAEECARALAAGRADVPRVVRRLRAQRPHSLTNRHHYMFLYKLLSEYGNKLMGGGVDNI